MSVQPSRSRGAALIWILLSMVLTVTGCDPQPDVGEKALPRFGAEWFIPGATDALPSPEGDRIALVRGSEVLVFDLFQPKRGAISVGRLPCEGTAIVGWTLEDQGWAVVIVAGKKDPYAHEREYWLVSIDSPGVIRKLGEARWISWKFEGGSVAVVGTDTVAGTCLVYTNPTLSLSSDQLREMWQAPAGYWLRYFRAVTPSLAVAETVREELATDGRGFYPIHELWAIDLPTGAVTPIRTGRIDVIENWYPSPDGSRLALLGFSRGDPRGAVVSLGPDREVYDLGPSDVSSVPRWAEDSSCFLYRSFNQGPGPLMVWKAADRTPAPLPLFGFPMGGPNAQAAPLQGGRWLVWDGTSIGIVDEVSGEAGERGGPYDPSSVWVTAEGRVFGYRDKAGMRVVVLGRR